MTLETLSPRKLQPNPWNTNRLSLEAEGKLERSLQRVGMFKPIIVRTLSDGSRQVLGGQHRAEAAERIGMEEIPAYNLGVISDERAKEIGIIDNTRYGHDDAEAFAALLKEIGTPAELAEFLPFDMGEIDRMNAASTIDLDKLGLEEEEAPGVTPDDKAPKVPKTHNVMRFKVPVEDSHTIEKLMKRIIEEQDIEDSDSLVKAGDALMWLVRNYEGTA